jgi:hypothetical protein
LTFFVSFVTRQSSFVMYSYLLENTFFTILYILFCLRYVNLKACISRLPEIGEEPTPSQWPARLMDPPKRLKGVKMDAYSSKNELFKAETKFWDDILEGYIRIFNWRKFKLRNVMDMRAGFGG